MSKVKDKYLSYKIKDFFDYMDEEGKDRVQIPTNDYILGVFRVPKELAAKYNDLWLDLLKFELKPDNLLTTRDDGHQTITINLGSEVQ